MKKENLLEKLSELLTMKKEQEKEIRELWASLPITPDYLENVQVDGRIGYVTVPDSTGAEDWLLWKQYKREYCTAGHQRCEYCQDECVGPKTYMLTPEEFLQELKKYYAGLIDQYSYWIGERKELIRILRTLSKSAEIQEAT